MNFEICFFRLQGVIYPSENHEVRCSVTSKFGVGFMKSISLVL